MYIHKHIKAGTLFYLFNIYYHFFIIMFSVFDYVRSIFRAIFSFFIIYLLYGYKHWFKYLTISSKITITDSITH